MIGWCVRIILLFVFWSIFFSIRHTHIHTIRNLLFMHTRFHRDDARKERRKKMENQVISIACFIQRASYPFLLVFMYRQHFQLCDPWLWIMKYDLLFFSVSFAIAHCCFSIFFSFFFHNHIMVFIWILKVMMIWQRKGDIRIMFEYFMGLKKTIIAMMR